MKFNKSIFGMIHLYGTDPLERALEEIKIYQEEGVQGVIVENYHGSTDDVIDVLHNLKDVKIEIGINILPNEYDLAFELADKYGSFIQMDYISGRYERNTYLDNRSLYVLS
jgi:predicted TIM-barrel enzyme